MQIIQPGPNIGLSAGTQAQGAGTVVFSNSNNVTFGMTNSSVVTASASFPADQVVNISAGTQLATSGTVIFSNSNGFTFGMSNSSIVTASYTQSTAPGGIQAGTQTATSGTVVFSNSNGFTFGMTNSSIITASYTQSTAPGAIQAGTQTATSGTIIFSNSNGMTFGMSNSSIVTASYSRMAFSAGTLSIATGTLVFSNSNSVTFGMAGDPSGGTITASVSYTQSTAPGGIAAGTQTATSGTIVFSNSNGFTFGMSNSSIVTASYTQSTAPGGIAAGTQTATSGTIIFSNSNGVTFGMSNSSLITASVAGGGAAISAGTQSVSTGTVIFSNSNNVTFGMAGSATVTASVNPPTLNLWENHRFEQGTVKSGTLHGTLLFTPLFNVGGLFPGIMTANTVLFDVSCNNNNTSTSQAHTSTIILGIYTISGSSTLNLLNSVSTTWSFGAASSNSSNYHGPRFITIHSSLWSVAPSFSQTAYVMGYIFLSSGTAVQMSMLGQSVDEYAQRSGTIGTSVVTATTMGWGPYAVGSYSASTTGLPTSLQISEISRQTGPGGAGAQFNPHIIFNNLVSAF